MKLSEHFELASRCLTGPDSAKRDQTLIVADGLVYVRAKCMFLAGTDEETAERMPITLHSGIPFAVFIALMRELPRLRIGGRHNISSVRLIVPTDAGPDTLELLAVLQAASRRADFKFTLLRTPMSIDDAMAAWDELGSWQQVH
jgi:hypothetical protein